MSAATVKTSLTLASRSLIGQLLLGFVDPLATCSLPAHFGCGDVRNRKVVGRARECHLSSKACMWGLLWFGLGPQNIAPVGGVRRRRSTGVIRQERHRAPALFKEVSDAVPSASAAAAGWPGTGAPVEGGVFAPRATAAEYSPPKPPVLPPSVQKRTGARGLLVGCCFRAEN